MVLKGHNISLKGAFYYSKRFLKRFFSPSYHKNVRKWRELKGKYKGKRVFLIGNGPSLNKTPLYLLKNEYTMCFNRFELMTERFNWNPTFFAMSDMTVIEDSQEIINKTINKVGYSFFLENTIGSWSIRDVLPSRDNILYFYFEGNEFSEDLPFLKAGGTIAIDGLQILNYLGFDEIIIIGVDMNYVIQKSKNHIGETKYADIVQSTADDDPNHFDPRYFGKGAKYTNPDEKVLKAMLNSLANISEWFRNKTSTKVYNAGYDSMVESFERKDFMDVLNYSDTKINSLFNEVVRKFGFSSLEDMLAKTTLCNSIAEFDEDKDIISLPIEEGIKIVKKEILSFIPIGPYKGKIYFVKRNKKK